ncbi:hypothetical protein CER19_20550 [Pseudomonas sp. GL93]|nr:hypothetical protein CER19_20550 [Pseudomonas sp. GL93]
MSQACAATASLTDKTGSNCGSWLACDADNSGYLVHRVDAIAGKPAPTFDPHRLQKMIIRPDRSVRIWPGYVQPTPPRAIQLPSPFCPH